MKRGVMFAAVAALCVAMAPSPTWAAIYWKGTTDSSWGTGGNWKGTSGRTYFFKSQSPSRNVSCLDKNYTGSFKWPSGGSAYYHGLCFGENPDSGPWRLHGTVSGTTYSFDNSGGDAYNTGIICVGYDGESSSARFYAINLTCKNFTIGGDTTSGGASIVKKNMTGHLVLDDQNNDANGYLAPVSITATSTCDFYKGDLYATNATITCSGNMSLYNFTAEKSGGDWTITNNLYVSRSGGTATLTQKSGTITVNSGGDLKIGDGGGTATITQKGGTFTVNSSKWTRFESGSTCTLNLDGGTFKTKLISNEGATSASIVFNGGTLQANGYDSRGLVKDSTINVTVKEGGATVNTGGLTPILNAAFNKASGVAGDLTVTGGGTATFTAMGDISGALNVGDGTTLRWFDQDGTVSATCGFTSLALGAGSTVYLDGDATGVDALPATVTTTATAESKANIVINFSAIPATGSSFTLFPVASADVFNVSPMAGSLVLPNEVAVVNGSLVLTIVAEDYTWNGTQTNWGDADAWTKGGAAATWADGNNAIFNTANATADLAADASAAELRFTADATISGSSTLTVSSVSVVPSVSATISAPTAGTLEKTGAGTLTLGASRSEQTTVSEGTLTMADGATVDPSKLTLGTDPAKPVTFDYGGQTLSGKWTDYLASGMDITLTNGTFSTTQNPGWTCTSEPKTLTIAKDAIMTTSERFTWNASTTAGAYVTNYVNIAGGALVSTKNNNNWIVQDSRSGTLKFDVFDGGLLEFAYKTLILPCRDSTTDNDTPSVLMTFKDSTFRVKNNNLYLGSDEDTLSSHRKNPKTPVFELAMTNSTLDVGTGIVYLGFQEVRSNHGGHATADFENCVITAREFKVYYDRPANAARFNNTTIAFTTGSTGWAFEAQKDWADSPGEEWAGTTPISVGPLGLALDTQDNTGCGVKADIAGGPVTKKGSGKLTIYIGQTSSSDGFICEEGETILDAGLTMNRAVYVKGDATFSVKATAKSTVTNLTLEAGSTLNIDTPTVGVTPIAVTTLTLPANGTVALKKNGGAFAKGLYPIFEKTGITAADATNLVPNTSDLPYEWKVQGNALVLAVDTDTSGFVWTGLAGDGKMSTGGNWLNGVAPSAAGTALDFSGVITATTIIGDIDVTFGAVTMGDGVITFTGDKMAATSFSDTSKIAVGANSTVTLDGNLVFSGTEKQYVVNAVAAGGRFIVTGNIEASNMMTGGEIFQCVNPSAGAVQAKGLVANEGTSDEWIFRLAPDKDGTANWIVGADGLSGSKYFWALNNSDRMAAIQPLDADFGIATKVGIRAPVTLNTTGYDGNGHTITVASAGIISRDGALTVSGTGKVLVDAVNEHTAGVTVTNTATLAINAGKRMTTGAITVNSGATLEVAESAATRDAASVTLGGNLTLADGAALAFNFTENKMAPVLDVTSKTVTAAGTVNVKIAAASGIRPVTAGGKFTLTSGGKFKDAAVSLADGTPDWVKSVSVVDGDIVLDVRPVGTIFFVK